MNEFLTFYEQAELAMAAYADLVKGEPIPANLKNAGMSTLQAAEFSRDWRVIDQYDGMIEETYVDEFGKVHHQHRSARRCRFGCRPLRLTADCVVCRITIPLGVSSTIIPATCTLTHIAYRYTLTHLAPLALPKRQVAA